MTDKLRFVAQQVLTDMEAQGLLMEWQTELRTALAEQPKFQRGDLVRKKSGSQWQGRVVGEYSTALTPEGYAVESDAHAGSVQIYPAHALEGRDE